MRVEPKGEKNEQIGKSRGGRTSKIHALCDSHGNPMKFILTGGEESDYKQALALLKGQQAGHVLADRGYDADYIVQAVESMGAVAVIPPRKNRREQRKYDARLYKERNLVERLFLKMKRFRGFATRYEKLASSFLSFAHFIGILIWLE